MDQKERESFFLKLPDYLHTYLYLCIINMKKWILHNSWPLGKSFFCCRIMTTVIHTFVCFSPGWDIHQWTLSGLLQRYWLGSPPRSQLHGVQPDRTDHHRQGQSPQTTLNQTPPLPECRAVLRLPLHRTRLHTSVYTFSSCSAGCEELRASLPVPYLLL